MPAPERIAAFLKDNGYHPRSSRHGDALCLFVLEDLVACCEKIREDAREGRLVYCLKREIIVGNSNWNIDLVLGPPPGNPCPPADGEIVANSPPAAIRIAIEAKSIMTEHGKARRNRLRDLDSFHQFVHRYDPTVIAAALTMVNIAPQFRSPLRPTVSKHANIVRLATETISLLRTLPVCAQAGTGGLDANAVILVTHDNVDSAHTALVSHSPAPAVGDPLNYDSFLHRICDHYTRRWR